MFETSNKLNKNLLKMTESMIKRLK